MALAHMGIFNANIKYGVSVVLSSGVQEMPGFSNALALPPLVFLFIFFCSLLSVQPSPAEKLTVLLIFDTAMEQTKEKRKGVWGRVGLLCMGR